MRWVLVVAELILFPDVEQVAIDVIDAALSDLGDVVPVGTAVPEDEDEFIRVLGIGGLPETMVSEVATVTVEGWAKTETRARDLCDIARAALRAYAGNQRPAFSHPQNLPDPTTDRVRYTSTGDVRVWGAATTP